MAFLPCQLSMGPFLIASQLLFYGIGTLGRGRDVQVKQQADELDGSVTEGSNRRSDGCPEAIL
jgi:hypothetical protein